MLDSTSAHEVIDDRCTALWVAVVEQIVTDATRPIPIPLHRNIKDDKKRDAGRKRHNMEVARWLADRDYIYSRGFSDVCALVGTDVDVAISSVEAMMPPAPKNHIARRAFDLLREYIWEQKKAYGPYSVRANIQPGVSLRDLSRQQIQGMAKARGYSEETARLARRLLFDVTAKHLWQMFAITVRNA